MPPIFIRKKTRLTLAVTKDFVELLANSNERGPFWHLFEFSRPNVSAGGPEKILDSQIESSGFLFSTIFNTALFNVDDKIGMKQRSSIPNLPKTSEDIFHGIVHVSPVGNFDRFAFTGPAKIYKPNKWYTPILSIQNWSN